MHDFIRIKGAREHNLKNIDLDLPRNKLVVITGVSGSGKSSLAFNTLYAEGQKRYVESLSAYARQFLGVMDKPDVDSIEGLSPAIAIEQKTAGRNPRSTVGTITEIYDYLRLLFARVGVPHCPVCHKVLRASSTDKIVDSLQEKLPGKAVRVLAPIVRAKKGTYAKLLEEMQKKGFSRVRVDGVNYEIGEEIQLDKNVKHSIEVVVDRMSVSKENASRLSEAIDSASALAEGFVIVAASDKDFSFSKKLDCVEHEISVPELQPRMFSFNSPFGACPQCHGLGFKQEFHEDLILPDKTLSILKGAIALPGYRSLHGWLGQQLAIVSKHYKIDISRPWRDLSGEHRQTLLWGSKDKMQFNYVSAEGSQFSSFREFEGIIPMQKRLYLQT
ncbi:MAG: excinuclease ABC subunit UvrA, partial [Candidatus Diapherotrites archaeon]|nr:excinuclease ABC subunit UvrA [Candidatus Diapherotrites archaeon]